MLSVSLAAMEFDISAEIGPRVIKLTSENVKIGAETSLQPFLRSNKTHTASYIGPFSHCNAYVAALYFLYIDIYYSQV